MTTDFLDTSFLKTDEITLSLNHAAPANPERGWVPAYHFDICDPAGEKMGACDLRLGYNDRLYYGGHIGYRVEEPYRGHHYAEKACRLLFQLAKKHDMPYLIVTCNPENAASRRTCERLGGELLEIAELPEDSDMRVQSGETRKCVFRFAID
ncbi:MAG: GNAT family N-acetyltransferase [Clostridia bacterium]|nr:GNAT family N-acetyltransferase [Clostridia bacterium]